MQEYGKRLKPNIYRTLSPDNFYRMNIYNSVLLNQGGIIEQVRTTFISTKACQHATLQKIEKYITLYTFSVCIEDKFTEAFLPYRFEVDDTEPADDYHCTLQEVILAGSCFIDQQKQTSHVCYAELVVACDNDGTFNETDIMGIIRRLLNYYNREYNWSGWKAFAWRKISVDNKVMMAVSLGNEV